MDLFAPGFAEVGAGAAFAFAEDSVCLAYSIAGGVELIAVYADVGAFGKSWGYVGGEYGEVVTVWVG